MRSLTSASKVDTLFNTVVDGGYCIGCGACAVVQNSPISIELDQYGCFRAIRPIDARLERVDPNVLAVCPFSDEAQTEDEIGKALYGAAGTADHRLGYHLMTFAGYVAEGDFRACGSSGGMGRWIACELLREGLIDAVVQVAPNEPDRDAPLLYRYRVASSAEEVMSGAKSAYYPVELSGVLRHIQRWPGRYTVTGGPCFVKAVRLLSYHDPILRERVRFCVGLMCGHLKSTRYADMLAWQRGIPPGNLERIDFRKKLPGKKANEKGVELIGSRGSERVREIGVVQEFFGTNYGHGFFKYKACDYCDDVVAETADIAVGDAWLPGYREDGAGNNVVIIRNAEILDLIQRGIRSGRLRLEPIGADVVATSQAAGLRHRSEGLAYRLYLADRAGVWRPPKRVQANGAHLDWQRKRIYEFRIELSRESHEAFQKAAESERFSLFQDRMQSMLRQYAGLNAPRFWRRILLRLSGKLKAAVLWSARTLSRHLAP